MEDINAPTQNMPEGNKKQGKTRICTLQLTCLIDTH